MEAEKMKKKGCYRIRRCSQTFESITLNQHVMKRTRHSKAESCPGCGGFDTTPACVPFTLSTNRGGSPTLETVKYLQKYSEIGENIYWKRRINTRSWTKRLHSLSPWHHQHQNYHLPRQHQYVITALRSISANPWAVDKTTTGLHVLHLQSLLLLP